MLKFCTFIKQWKHSCVGKMLIGLYSTRCLLQVQCMHEILSSDAFFHRIRYMHAYFTHVYFRARVPRYKPFIGKAAVRSTIGGIPLLHGSLCSSKITIVVVIINMRYAEDAFDFRAFTPLHDQQETVRDQRVTVSRISPFH